MNDGEEQLREEAIAYFREEVGLAQILDGFAAKYRSLGRLSGSLTLSPASEAERTALASLLRAPVGVRLRLSWAAFDAALSRTRFAALDRHGLLEAWLGGPLRSKSEERELDQRDWQRQLAAWRAEIDADQARAWLDLLARPEWAQRYRALQLGEPKAQQRAQAWVLRALSERPEGERLPLFAARICGQPHAFDQNEAAGRLLLLALEALGFAPKCEADEPSSPVERFAETLFNFGLLRDENMNFVSCCGLTAYRGTDEVRWWREAASDGAALNLNARELERVDHIQPARGWEAQPWVGIVENSSVFSALLDAFPEQVPALICTHGQFRLAAWLILQRLLRTNQARARYSGDFDAGGLSIARRLSERYGAAITLWRMSPADYNTSAPSTPLGQPECARMAADQHPETAATSKAIAARGKAGYQENLIEALIADIKESFPL